MGGNREVFFHDLKQFKLEDSVQESVGHGAQAAANYEFRSMKLPHLLTELSSLCL